jgi:hypothetical protein
MIDYMKTFKDLKNFLNTFSDEQLDKEATISSDDKSVVITGFESAKEDWYYSEQYRDEPLFTKSEAGHDFDEEDSVLCIPKGSPIIWGE